MRESVGGGEERQSAVMEQCVVKNGPDRDKGKRKEEKERGTRAKWREKGEGCWKGRLMEGGREAV